MKKTLWTLNIDDYAPAITALTYPLLERYAHKIGADFQIIDERWYPDWPVVYENLQIYRRGRGNDWNLYIDSDALVHPDLFDITEVLSRDTVLHNGRTSPATAGGTTATSAVTVGTSDPATGSPSHPTGASIFGSHCTISPSRRRSATSRSPTAKRSAALWRRAI